MEKKHERFEMIEIHSMRVGIEVGGTGWGADFFYGELKSNLF